MIKSNKVIETLLRVNNIIVVLIHYKRKATTNNNITNK